MCAASRGIPGPRPRARFVNGVNATKKQTAAPLGCFAAYAVLEFLSLQETVPPADSFLACENQRMNRPTACTYLSGCTYLISTTCK